MGYHAGQCYGEQGRDKECMLYHILVAHHGCSRHGGGLMHIKLHVLSVNNKPMMMIMVMVMAMMTMR